MRARSLSKFTPFQAQVLHPLRSIARQLEPADLCLQLDQGLPLQSDRSSDASPAVVPPEGMVRPIDAAVAARHGVVKPAPSVSLPSMTAQPSALRMIQSGPRSVGCEYVLGSSTAVAPRLERGSASALMAGGGWKFVIVVGSRGWVLKRPRGVMPRANLERHWNGAAFCRLMPASSFFNGRAF